MQITAHTPVLADHTTIATRNFSARGDARDITLRIEGPRELCGMAVITTEASHADGGNLRLTPQDWVRLQYNSTIAASVGGGRTTAGGNLPLSAPWVILEGNHTVANAFEEMGGGFRLKPGQRWPTPPVASTPGRNGASRVTAMAGARHLRQGKTPQR